MNHKEDCPLGIGYNANLMVADLAVRDPWYLRFVYENNGELTEEVRKVIEQYIEVKKEIKPMAKTTKETQETQEDNLPYDLFWGLIQSHYAIL